MRVVVFAAGNEARGDDALGPMLAARLDSLRLRGVTVHCDFQFQVEHALDLPQDGMALFVDAHCNQAQAVCFEALCAAEPFAGSHALTPAQVLGVAQRIGHASSPAWLLSLGARSFGLGEPLSARGQLALGSGWGLMRSLLASPGHRAWAAKAAAYAAP